MIGARWAGLRDNQGRIRIEARLELIRPDGLIQYHSLSIKRPSSSLKKKENVQITTSKHVQITL